MQNERQSLDKVLGLGTSLVVVGLLATGCSFASNKDDISKGKSMGRVETIREGTFEGDHSAALGVEGIANTFAAIYGSDEKDSHTVLYPGSEKNIEVDKEIEAAEDIYFGNGVSDLSSMTSPKIKRIVDYLIETKGNYSSDVTAQRKDVYEELQVMDNKNELEIEQRLRSDAYKKVGGDYVSSIRYEHKDLDGSEVFAPSLGCLII